MTLDLVPIVDGNRSGHTLVFVQGWPDDASLWDEAVAALGTRYRCVRVDMPNYGDALRARWGFDTETIIDALVRHIRAAAAATGPVTLVLHDWGCYWGHPAHHRCAEAVARVVGLDVAPHYHPTPKAIAGIVAYQGWLFSAFVGGGRVGDWMTRAFAKRSGAPAPREKLHAQMNYPYRNVWADLLSGRDRQLTKGYWPTCPLLFVYGARKPFMFHSREWTDHVEKVGGEVVALETGHWVQRDPSFVEVLSRWLRATDDAVGVRRDQRATT